VFAWCSFGIFLPGFECQRQGTSYVNVSVRASLSWLWLHVASVRPLACVPGVLPISITFASGVRARSRHLVS
jgi:hypothetical protein